MSNSPIKKPFIARPLSVFLLVVLAFSAWGFNWWQQSRNAPVRTHIEAGIKYLEQGQGPSAEREWRQAVRLDKRNAEAWEYLANYYMAAGNWAEARHAWNQVLANGSPTTQIHYQIAVCNVRLNDLIQARPHAEAVLKEDANHIGALDILTTVMVRNSDEKPRLKRLEHLVALQPENEEYIGRLAEAYVDDKQYKKARPLLDKLLALRPDFGAAYALRGATILYTDTTPRGLGLALDDLQKALVSNPTDAVALLFIGKAYLRLKQPKAAIFHLKKLERLPTAHESYLFEMANAYKMAGDLVKARETRQRYAALQQQRVQIERFESKLATTPNDFETNLNLGLLLLTSRRPVRADQYINKAASLRPSDPRAKAALNQLESTYVRYLNAGLAALKKQDYDKVGVNLGQAMMLRPKDQRTTMAIQQFQVVSESGINPYSAPPVPDSQGATRGKLSGNAN